MNRRSKPISNKIPKAKGSEPIWSLKTEVLAEVKQVPTKWIARAPNGKGFLPSGLSVIVGDPGSGKSTLIRAVLACLTTCRGAFQCDIGKALFLCWEDGEGSLILPHLISCGGDPWGIRLVRGIENDIGDEAQFLPANIGLVREHLEKNPDCRMVVVDVLASLTALGGGNSDRSEDIRGLLDPLHKLGMELDVAMVAIHHQNKRTSEGALTRVSGSVQVSGTARLVWAVGADPDDPDIRRVALVKGNIPGRCKNGFAFREVSVDRGQVVAFGQAYGVAISDETEDEVFQRLEIVEGLSPISANDLARGQSATGKESSARKAEDWLRGYLAEHGEESDQALKEAAKAAGVGRNALWDAKRVLKEAGHIRHDKRDGVWWTIGTAPEGKTFEDVFGGE